MMFTNTKKKLFKKMKKLANDYLYVITKIL